MLGIEMPEKARIHSVTTHQSPGSEEGTPQLEVDSRRRKRMLSNRDSARRSRMRKQQKLDDMISQGAKLRDENRQIAMQAEMLGHQYLRMDSENAVLRSQVMELTEKLQSLNSVLRFVEEFTGVAVDIPEIPDMILNPWQLPYPSQPIIANTNMFQC